MPPEPAPFLSVITVCRNAAPTVAATLASAAAQIDRDTLLEHIVVDGASTDDTLTIVKQFPHVRWISEPDRGIADAFNKGMRLARGEYLLYLNADDRLHDPAVVRDLQRFAVARGMPDWIAGDYVARTVDGRTRVLKRRYPLTCWSLSLQLRINHQSLVLKRSVQEAMGGFRLEYRTGMDYDLWARLCQAGYRITGFPRVLTIYAEGGQSMTQEEITAREHREVMDRLRDTPLKRLAGFLFDQYKAMRRHS
jgi:glycosyltransferase involved in cell wall biosynthesis